MTYSNVSFLSFPGPIKAIKDLVPVFTPYLAGQPRVPAKIRRYISDEVRPAALKSFKIGYAISL